MTDPPALLLAVDLLVRGDREVLQTIGRSLQVSLTAASIAFVLGAPCGGWLAVVRFPGRWAVLVMVNAALGLPPVVVGLVVYLTLSRAGPLGALDLLFTPPAMVLAQTMLALPIVVALVHRAATSLWSEYGDALTIDGASRRRAAAVVLAMMGPGLVTAFLAAFGRAIAEVGALLVVGGNIAGVTRTMTTAIALETSKGDLPRALAFGMILIALTIGVTGAAFLVGRLAERR